MRNVSWATECGPVIGEIKGGKKYPYGTVSAEQYEAEIADIESRLAGIAQSILNVENKTTVTENEVSVLSSRYNSDITQIVSDLSKVKSDVAALQASADAINTRISDLASKEENDITSVRNLIDSKIESVNDVIRILESSINALNTTSGKLTSRISDVETVLATLRNQHLNDTNQLNSRIDQLSNNEITIKAAINAVGDTVNALATDTAASIASLNERIANIEGGETVEIMSFTARPNVCELGGTENIILAWTTRGDVKVTRINGEVVSGNEITMSNVSAATEYTLSVTDAKGVTVTKKVSVTFVNHIFWGVDASGGTGEGVVKALDFEEMSDTRARTFTVNPRDQYIVYAYPKRLGTSIFMVNGFTGGFKDPAVVQMDNHSGYVEDYYVYRSEQKLNVNFEVKVM